jgi:hypothetical protein
MRMKIWKLDPFWWKIANIFSTIPASNHDSFARSKLQLYPHIHADYRIPETNYRNINFVGPRRRVNLEFGSEVCAPVSPSCSHAFLKYTSGIEHWVMCAGATGSGFVLIVCGREKNKNFGRKMSKIYFIKINHMFLFPLLTQCLNQKFAKLFQMQCFVQSGCEKVGSWFSWLDIFI